jgi:hypothetical protein
VKLLHYFGLLGSAMLGSNGLGPDVIDGCEQGSVLERLEEIGFGARGLTEFAHVVFAMRGNHDGRNSDARTIKVALQFQTVHLRHLQIDNQTFGQFVGCSAG